ncbi:DUF2798 domain-containing protein [Ciceribacter sp. L1K23]|nr:DUF2798 domain-containing protein [Ciceribacter sp. L1K23]
MMSCIVSGLATALGAGIDGAFPLLWLRAWVASWAIAFPSVLLVAPLVRRILARVVVRD